MKKLLLVIMAMISLNAFAQLSESDNGFGIKLGVGIPSSDYGTIEKGESKVGINFGLEIDNRWYVWHNDKIGVAINARWFDMSYGAGNGSSTDDITLFGKKIGSLELEYEQSVFYCNMLGVGPMFTFYLNQDMAIDAYYNINPAFQYTFVTTTETTTYIDKTEDSESSSFDMATLGAGFAHVFGASFRYKVFQAGVEYNLATLSTESVSSDIEEMDFEDIDFSGNFFKIYLGFKF